MTCAGKYINIYEEGKMRHCKWCGLELADSFTDNQCDGCWEVVCRIDDIINIDKLRIWVKEKIEKKEEKKDT